MSRGALVLGFLVALSTSAQAQEEEEAELDVEVRADATEDVERTSASGRQITQTMIRAQPKRTAEALLRLTPGILVVQHGSEGKGHQLFLRGFDAVHGSDLEITLDGIPINEASNVHGHGYIDLNFIIPEVVQSIEAVKGPFQLQQGNFATAGSARFRLGVEAPLRGWTSGYQAGTTGRHRLYSIYAPRSAAESSFVAVEALRDDGYGQARSTERASALSQWQLFSSADRGRLEVLGGAYASRFGLPGALRAQDVREGTLGFYDAWRDDTEGTSLRALTAVRYSRAEGDADLKLLAWGGWRDLDLVEDFTGYLLNPEAGDRRHQRQRTRSLGGRLLYQRYPTEAITLSSGLSFQVDHGDQREENVNAAHDPLELRRDLTYAQTLAAAWLGAEWRPLPQLRLDLGLRGDLVRSDAADNLQPTLPPSRQTFPHLAPRLSAAWAPRDDLTLYAAAGRGLRAPEARASVPGGGTPENTEVDRFQGGDARITSSTAAELGARWRLAAPLELTLAGFGVWISRESLFDHVSGLNLEVNPSRRLGLEAAAVYTPLRWLHLRADATAVLARFVDSGAPVPGAPSLLGALEAEATHPAGWRAGTRLLAIAPRPLLHGAMTSALFTWDAALGYRWRALDLSLEVENILDLAWREGEYHYASWFNRDNPRSNLPVLHYVAGTPLQARLSAAWTF